MFLKHIILPKLYKYFYIMMIMADFNPAYDFVFRLDKRIHALDKDSKFIAEKINDLSQNKISAYAELQSDMALLKKRISEIKTDLRNCILEMSGLSSQLKDSVRIDDKEQLDNMLKELPFEEFVTKREIHERHQKKHQ
jgi:hypothetical protein